MTDKKTSLIILGFWLLLPAALLAQETAGYLERMKSPDPDVRMAAAQEAGEKGREEAVPGLIALLEDDSDGVVINSMVSLGYIHDDRALEPLAAVVEKSSSAAVRIMGAQTLRHFSGERSAALLRKLADDADPQVRAAACRSLGRSGRAEDLDKLQERAEKDGDARVRRTAVSALAEVTEIRAVDAKKKKEILKTLGRAAKDKDERTKKSAKKAVERVKKQGKKR